MSLTKLCTRAVPMIITLAALAAPAEAAAQRTDYTYKRNLAPQGITTTDFVICDFAGNHVNTLRGEAILEDGKLITDAALNPTGTSILVLSIDKKKKSATVYETQQYNTKLHKFDDKKTDGTTPLAIGYTSDARQLLIAGSDSILRMYHPTTFKPIRTLTFDYAPTSFVLSDNGYYLATTDGHRVDVYNFETGKGRKAWDFESTVKDMATVSLGNYDRTNNVLAVDFDNMPTIFLEVPESDLGAFTKASDLEFKNAKYGVLPNDHFELIYAEVLNKADGKTYIFSNLDRVNLNYMNSDDNVVSLEIIQQQQMEEMRLQQLREKVIAEAKSSNVISDHTSITVDSRVVPDYDADGTSEMQTFFIVSESAASKARIRALDNALKESEAAQRHADKIADFVRAGFDR